MIYKGMGDLLHLSDLCSWKKPFPHLWHVSYFISIGYSSCSLFFPHSVDGSDQDLCNASSQLSLETSG